MNRKEIEDMWVEKSIILGKMLCGFTDKVGLYYEWNEVWKHSEHASIDSYFNDDDDWTQLSYLTRALSLNMLLDDCGIL